MTPQQKRRRKYRDRRKQKRAAAMTVILKKTTQNSRYFEVEGLGNHHEVRQHRRYWTNWLWTDSFCDCGNGSSPCAHVIAVVNYIKEQEKTNSVKA